MKKISVKVLSEIAGVTVRTLHLYDEMGLLVPSVRTEAGYRYYQEQELYRLQQILFYKELGVALKDIAEILDDPDFDLIRALESHKISLQSKEQKLHEMLRTIDNTIITLKEKRIMENFEQLYKGFSKEQIEEYRGGAVSKYGAEAVEKSEKHLGGMSKERLATLKEDAREVTERLLSLMHKSPDDPLVQKYIERHYQVIRQFWGTAGSDDPQWEAYKGLGELYVNDQRFKLVDNEPNPEFARFMCDAMKYFVEEKSAR